jgi:hypothetical protein
VYTYLQELASFQGVYEQKTTKLGPETDVNISLPTSILFSFCKTVYWGSNKISQWKSRTRMNFVLIIIAIDTSIPVGMNPPRALFKQIVRLELEK